MTDRPFADHAARYFALGWPPIPIRNRRPIAAGATGRNGQDLSAADIATWAESDGDANIGLRMPNGVVGVDVDHYDDKTGGDTIAALEAELGELPSTWRSSARGADSPSGIRFYRIAPWVELVGELDHEGVSFVETIQRHHRFAIVAPTMHRSGQRYQWIDPADEAVDTPPTLSELPMLPEAWTERFRIDQRRPERHERLEVAPAHAEPTQWAQCVTDAHRGLWSALYEGSGSRHDAMLKATGALARFERQGHQGATSALEDLRERFALVVGDEDGRDPRDEYDRAVAGARDLAATTPNRTEPWGHRIRSMKSVGGGGSPSPAWRDRLSDQDAAAAPQRYSDPEVSEAADRFRRNFYWRSQLDAIPEPEPLVDNMIDRGRVCQLFGSPGSSKTWAAMWLAGAVAYPAVDQWLKHRVVHHGPVLYICAEGEWTVRQRMEMFERQHELDEDDNLGFLTVPASLVTDAEIAALIDLIAEMGPFSLIVWDTLARNLTPGDENSGQDIGIAYRHLEELARLEGQPTQLLIHHTGHAAKNRGRGHSSLYGALDIELKLEIVGTWEHDESSHVVELEETKQKGRPTGRKTRFLRKTVGQGCELLPWDDSMGAIIDNTAAEDSGGAPTTTATIGRARQRRRERAIKAARTLTGLHDNEPKTQAELKAAMGLLSSDYDLFNELVHDGLLIHVQGSLGTRWAQFRINDKSIYLHAS